MARSTYRRKNRKQCKWFFPVPAQWWAILGNVVTHNAYHIGQIIYIRKLQKSWKVNDRE